MSDYRTSLLRTLQRVAGDPSPAAREMFLASLMRDENDEAAAVLEGSLATRDGRALTLAVEALWSLRGPRALPLFKRSMLGSDLELRRLAARMMVRIGEPAVLDLCDMLRHASWDVRARAVEALGVIRDPRALAPLCRRLEDEHELVRIRAAHALGTLAHPGAAEALCAAVSDPSPQVQEAVILALARLPDGDFTEVLAPLVRVSSDPVVRSTALQVLLTGGWTAAGADLETRVFVALSTGALGELEAWGWQAVGPLCVWLREGEPFIQRRAIEALRQMAREHPTPRLRAALPFLRHVARSGPPSLKSEAGRTAAAIERAVGKIHNLPLPSRPPTPDPATLPRMAERDAAAPDRLRAALGARVMRWLASWRRRR